MRLFRLVLAAAATLSMASTVQAGDSAKPQLFVCERPTPAKHVIHRDHGRLAFVSAERLLNERAAPSRPRCITGAELTRYRTLAAQRTRTIASR